MSTTARYHWHDSIAKELGRLRECGRDAAAVATIASNLRMSAFDVRKYLGEMATWNEVRPAAALWDFAPDDWWQLTGEFNASNPDRRTYEIREYVTTGNILATTAFEVVDSVTGERRSAHSRRDAAEAMLATLHA